MLSRNSLLLLLLLPSVAYAWGPTTHAYFAEYWFEHGTGEIHDLCSKYKNEFMAGLYMPDITIFYYYTSGKTYKATHNWNFIDEALRYASNDAERCFVYGMAAHEVMDYVSHNYFVPGYIKSTMLPNAIIHPVVEGIVEANVIKQHPKLYERVTHDMDILFRENPGSNPRLLKIVEKALGEYTPIDVEENARRLDAAIGGFYEEAFVNPGTGTLGTIYKSLANVFGGVEVNVDEWKMRNFREMEYIFNNWQQRYTLSPHGFEELMKSEKERIIMLLSLVSVSILSYFFYFRKFGKKGVVASVLILVAVYVFLNFVL
ncbi:MAG: zinc dependent phospholipase C family protein [Deltaproteobacteria bacterium]|nr:zinc dependent phospholipase C family protein [Deltaproteobacteria bacterium]